MRSSRAAARAAVLLGAPAVLAIPIGVAASWYVSGLTLLESLWGAVPAGGVLGLLAVAASRRARFNLARSLHPEQRGLVRLGRILAWLGIYLAVTGGIALGVYGALRLAE